MEKIRVPSLLKHISSHFTSAGFKVYLVGGAVRDIFLDRQAGDWDIATNATPDEVKTLFHHIIPTGIDHGTVTIPYKGMMIECTTFRTETGYSDGRRPDGVRYTATIEEDLSRRDFTMNAIAVSLPDGIIVDPFNGRGDITGKVIRTVGDPSERFTEDGLRPLRAVRFSSQLDFTIDGQTLAAIRPALGVTATVAKERLREEFSRILLSQKPSTGLRFMEQTGLLELIFPELQRCRGIEQKGMHIYDVLDHLFQACDASPRTNLIVRLAALFHDVGKPDVRVTDGNGSWTFFNHEKVSAQKTQEILTRLRYPLRIIKDVTHLVSLHMFHYEPVWSDAAVRRFIVKADRNMIDSLFDLRKADSYAITGIAGHNQYLEEFRNRIDAMIEAEHAFSLKDLVVNGRDLADIGIPSGPLTGVVLKELLEAVIEDPDLNTKSALLDIAREIHTQKIQTPD